MISFEYGIEYDLGSQDAGRSYASLGFEIVLDTFCDCSRTETTFIYKLEGHRVFVFPPHCSYETVIGRDRYQYFARRHRCSEIGPC